MKSLTSKLTLLRSVISILLNIIGLEKRKKCALLNDNCGLRKSRFIIQNSSTKVWTFAFTLFDDFCHSHGLKKIFLNCFFWFTQSYFKVSIMKFQCCTYQDVPFFLETLNRNKNTRTGVWGSHIRDLSWTFSNTNRW